LVNGSPRGVNTHDLNTIGGRRPFRPQSRHPLKIGQRPLCGPSRPSACPLETVSIVPDLPFIRPYPCCFAARQSRHSLHGRIRRCAIHPAEGGTHDAILISPHRFPGGPGATVVTVIGDALGRRKTPIMRGGGTVSFVPPRITSIPNACRMTTKTVPQRDRRH
jgi:hypothetical protein